MKIRNRTLMPVLLALPVTIMADMDAALREAFLVIPRLGAWVGAGTGSLHLPGGIHPSLFGPGRDENAYGAGRVRTGVLSHNYSLDIACLHVASEAA